MTALTITSVREALRTVMPALPAEKAQEYSPGLAAAMIEAEITTPSRVAAFLAQLAHESGELRFMSEVWGPTPQQLRYEPPSSLARTLGNTQPGDGHRYMGRGPIQLTGRANYRNAGKDLGLDLENNPEIAADPTVGFRVAAWFWRTNRLNALADKGDFVGITSRINGASREDLLTGKRGHLAHRVKFHTRAQKHFGISR